MIEEYIANSQFQDALELLTDLDDEMVRYQRLVCLYGLGEYQAARSEGVLAKAKAGNTYYDVISGRFIYQNQGLVIIMLLV